MTTVGIAELKARLSEYIKVVRRGREITVLDRETPVARILPYDTSGLEVTRATRRPGDLKLPRRPRAATDSLAVLVDDRTRR